MTDPSWKAMAASIKADLASKFPDEWKLPPASFPLPLDVSHLVEKSELLNAAELKIISLDATGLGEAIASRKWTSVQVTMAYAKAATIVHQATNCLMDFFPDEAIERARWLDGELERTGRPVGVLHGVPVSIKAQIGVKGRLGTIGFIARTRVIETEASLVTVLRQAGAVFMVKTCLPQAIMHLETDSFFGPTLNPFNRSLTAGGSSGGEGALIAGKGSVLGSIGTDIGGSVRGPAALNGIYGFKPTNGRLPRGGGGMSTMWPQNTIMGTVGPMGRSARDLELFMATVLAARPWEFDQDCLKMPWRREEVHWINGKSPRIGVMWDDGVVRPQPPMRRALSIAVAKLRAAGLEVVKFEPYKSAEAWEIVSSLYFSDGGARVRQAAHDSGEPLLPLTEWILSQNTTERTAEDIIQLGLRRERFRAEFLAHFNAANVDVILCPPCPGPAPVLGTSKYWNYTALFNLVDYPGGSLPSGQSVNSSDFPDPEYSFASESDKEVWTAYDSPETFLGAPLGLQVVGQKYEDEKVLAALIVVSRIVQAH
ncbi:MAG: hypothetical protein TREMPRED_004052 [Tremellales sp. Tagirdzhanova-0007]|nr:MAG: hypothetical protein TREMPRED_004052 [Tremellales sp. Tagirdzhanova-0007]